MKRFGGQQWIMMLKIKLNTVMLKVTTPLNVQCQPLKMKEIPITSWHIVAVDIQEPYPGSKYILLLIDYRSRSSSCSDEVCYRQQRPEKPTKDICYFRVSEEDNSRQWSAIYRK